MEPKTVKAKLFESGDENGFSCIPFVSECSFTNNDGIYKDCKNCTLDIDKKPYISTLESNTHFGEFGKHYLCVGIDGKKWLVDKDIFERTYEVVS